MLPSHAHMRPGHAHPWRILVELRGRGAGNSAFFFRFYLVSAPPQQTKEFGWALGVVWATLGFFSALPLLLNTSAKVNANCNLNTKPNTNINANSNSNANANINANISININANSNINTNTNVNANVNINANDNVNINAIAKVNVNINVNANVNINANVNANVNTKVNINPNANINASVNIDADASVNVNPHCQHRRQCQPQRQCQRPPSPGFEGGSGKKRILVPSVALLSSPPPGCHLMEFGGRHVTETAPWRRGHRAAGRGQTPERA
ncbi:circumsporozoite protein-like [Heliangelus exortis]|uniref:circumsporozoite protein-like n=1 Tax=Heliangelus exortis TaxID=472823 RepID=UPI003A923091